jgi:hypothetical protein
MGIAAVDHDHEWLSVRFTDGTTGRFLGVLPRDNAPSVRRWEDGLGKRTEAAIPSLGRFRALLDLLEDQ